MLKLAWIISSNRVSWICKMLDNVESNIHGYLKRKYDIDLYIYLNLNKNSETFDSEFFKYIRHTNAKIKIEYLNSEKNISQIRISSIEWALSEDPDISHFFMSDDDIFINNTDSLRDNFDSLMIDFLHGKLSLAMLEGFSRKYISKDYSREDVKNHVGIYLKRAAIVPKEIFTEYDNIISKDLFLNINLCEDIVYMVKGMLQGYTLKRLGGFRDFIHFRGHSELCPKHLRLDYFRNTGYRSLMKKSINKKAISYDSARSLKLGPMHLMPYLFIQGIDNEILREDYFDRIEELKSGKKLITDLD